MKTNVYKLLVEALRRFECFAVRRDGKKWTKEDLMNAWIGLGTEADYRPTVEAGLMRIAVGASYPDRGCMGWWGLTERGANIIYRWHKRGFGCKNSYEIKKQPIISKCDEKELINT